MKVLLLTQWYPPEPFKLMSDLASTLQLLGNNVQVLTGFPNYPSGKVYPGYKISAWQRETYEEISLVRVALYPDHSLSRPKRILNYVSFAFTSSLFGPFLVQKPDVIFVYNLYSVFSAWLLSVFRRSRLVLNVQDMWPETLVATGMIHNRLLLSVIGWLAEMVYRLADAIVVISEGFRDNLISKGVPASKIHVIPNWVDSEHYKPVEPDPYLAESLGLAGRFNVMYAGQIGRAQGLDTLLRAAELLKDDPLIQFVLVGDGVERASLQAATAERNLNNIRFLGRYPEQDMPGILSLSDVLLVHLHDTPLFRITIPHKIVAYMAVGKPILAAVCGDAANLISNAGAGITCAPDNPAAMADGVRRFRLMTSQQRQKMGVSGRLAACEQYSMHQQVRKLDQLFRALDSTVTH